MANLLEIENLHVTFHTYAGEVQAVRGVDLTLREGESLAIVGESGSGKSVTMLSVMRLLPRNATVTGRIRFAGRDVLALRNSELRRVQGREIGMVFQDPMTSLNPTLTVGLQITESLRYHLGMGKREAEERAIELLKMVGVPAAESRLNQYPHQFSGGMRQRVMIAIALACQPRLLIADEPTTALDVTIQAQIMNLLKELKKKLNMSLILITHDLGIVAGMADRVMVMYGGQVVEQGPVRDIYYNSRHPYTWGLLRSVPRVHASRRERLESIPGSPPNLLAPPSGCPFHPRCRHAMVICEEEAPQLQEVRGEHRSACWLLHPQAPRVEWEEARAQ
ncbi:ABC transporter ATP-binding protein [Caldinitratiruptor microaerophilus]|uniref:ABC transporter ATP-binding protein n=1 Tax=Caldinitratiruptor microaerophilus TaxID=671077 RepID=A0AA35CN25_9FIRM|nr:ABC transporter ATP-binding protein [Caldinitratiruptor microaerophilus]BDG62152.1 ABC transporter ATP-binding protein [Caldinitratiruptor microaerophilus]